MISAFSWRASRRCASTCARARSAAIRPPVPQTIRAKQAGLAIEGWEHGFHPTLDGKPIALDPNERSRSLAVHPDGDRFVLGAEWSLRALDAKGQPLWRRAVPSTAWAVNITGDGRLAVAAYGDGTIRWHRMDDGRELLALYGLADKQNWVAWTPEGFYGATPGAFGVLQWQVNRGFDEAAQAVPVSEISQIAAAGCACPGAAGTGNGAGPGHRRYEGVTTRKCSECTTS